MWSEHVAAVLDRVGDDVLHAEYDGYFGRTTVGATLADFYGFDMVVHRWDLARALGREAPFSVATGHDARRSRPRPVRMTKQFRGQPSELQSCTFPPERAETPMDGMTAL